ncbi:hypothetical protein T484DRAFT_1850010 [Baffinella frigidus]|nr:hypothetical protein T484DRAFT_1850010 [Cryptophyta sp. CCMP2293]
MVDWVTRPDRWYYTGPGNPAPRNEIAPFGISGQLRKAGADGVAFEHYTGSVTEDASAKVRLRQLPACRPMVSHVFDCSAGDTATDEQGWRQRCEGALDDKGYRVFNDADFALTQPLQWYCAGKYCEGDSLTWDTVHLDLPTATVPAACPNGRRNKYLFLGEDDWGFDQSLHLCGYGTDRSAQHPACRRLPAGWFFNTSCSVSHWLNGESECGHAGWWMEGGYISSCTNAEDCAVDGSTSRLDLSINLPELHHW